MDIVAHRDQLLRVGVVQRLDMALELFGHDPEAVLEPIGLSRATLGDGDYLVNIGQVASALDHCARITECPTFSLRLAAAQDLSFLGGVGLMMQTASTLGEAIHELSNYVHIHAQPVSWIVEDAGDFTQLSFALDTPSLTATQRRLCVDLALGQCFQVIRTVTQDRAKLDVVRFHYDHPADLSVYRRYFDAPVEFNAEVDGFVLPSAAMDLPASHADTTLHEIVRGQLSQSVLYGIGSNLEREVRAVIRSLLPGDRCTIDRVAKCFGCNKRTLQRHLRREAGTSYHELLTEVRFELAEQYLRDSGLSVTQLAFAVGFSEASNFSRAFRKRYGISPNAYRAKHTSSDRMAGRLSTNRT